jgi:hypothetical protein
LKDIQQTADGKITYACVGDEIFKKTDTTS